jgi:hypothetical protein
MIFSNPRLVDGSSKSNDNDDDDMIDNVSEEMDNSCCSNFLNIGFLTGSNLRRQLSVANSGGNKVDSLDGCRMDDAAVVLLLVTTLKEYFELKKGRRGVGKVAALAGSTKGNKGVDVSVVVVDRVDSGGASSIEEEATNICWSTLRRGGS